MIKLELFKQNSYDDKKSILTEIFEQIQDEVGLNFEDTIFFLNASDKVKEETLDQIYKNLFDIIKSNEKNKHQKYLEELARIQDMMNKDQERESKEADLLLDSIE